VREPAAFIREQDILLVGGRAYAVSVSGGSILETPLESEVVLLEAAGGTL